MVGWGVLTHAFAQAPPGHMCLGGARPVHVLCPRRVGRASAHVPPRAKTPLRLMPEGLQSMLGSSGSFSCAGVSCVTRRNRPNLKFV